MELEYFRAFPDRDAIDNEEFMNMKTSVFDKPVLEYDQLKNESLQNLLEVVFYGFSEGSSYYFRKR